MDKPNTIPNPAADTAAQISRLPFVAMFLVGLVLLVFQHDYPNPRSANSLNNLQPDTTREVADARKPRANPGPVVTVSTDLPVNQNNNQTQSGTQTNADQPLPTSMSGARVALTRFTTALSIAEATQQSSNATSTAKPALQFRQTLKQSLFTAVVSSPFAVGFGDDARIAIWQENPQLALVNQAHQFVIMLDPGHGGSDPGSIGFNGLQEKTLTLDIAKRAKRLLSENENISVVLTRNSDNGLSRRDRVLKVMSSKADMFVSLHLNHLPQTDVNLVETFYAAPHNILESLDKQRAEQHSNGLVETAALNPNLDFTHGSRRLASIMQKRVFEEVIDNNPETDNAGVKEDTLYILTRSFTPGALIELSCLSNVKEASRLNSPAYRQKLAAALADGIRDYLNTAAAKHQFGPEV